MKRKLLLLALIPMLLTGCDFEPDSLGEDLSSIVSIQGKGEVYYPQEFTLKNDCLDQPSDVFNKDLALFTYGASVANKTKDTIITFYRDMMFSTLEVSSNYDITPTKDTIAYTIGSRMMNHSKVVLVSVRGFNYGTMVAKAQYLYSNFATFMLSPSKKRAKVLLFFELTKFICTFLLISAIFCAYSGRFSVSGIDANVGRQGKKRIERLHQLSVVSARQVGSSKTHAKEGVTG